jgi:hypothetical protein
MAATSERFGLASAQTAARRGRIAEWVGEFLASPGSDNAVLAAALAQRKHWWLGPLSIPLDELDRLAGPEADAACRVAPDEWEDDVESMTDELDEGWEPPPLLAQWSSRDGVLRLHDGNHRYEALRREGAADGWVIVWFDDPRDRDLFRASRVVVHPDRRRWLGGRTLRLVRAVSRRFGIGVKHRRST